MPVPKQRKTKSRQGNRRSHDALKRIVVFRCEKCGNAILPHRICVNCGTYKKREVVNVFAKLDKKEKKKREKEQAAYEKEQGQGGASGMEELSKK
ncbi:MAG: 50S ribosomal protein L32 [Candidatus Spechtbacteria bacterium RIFCSPHIGHO2_02_FULL_43_15b]|uniref:Large ribosomal subunit protein bL32 n=1 Tax=Candidatus Spechtbacteria bacterium RIFCSPHIGHO2_01_FULL_43_30 TaxID=1802158 RepID=A0A1G2H827_9BACT|nr:MAG: 50S ribosomal protein L32 [Candidatus Spechtbacteria bacterium RIFCSPHIGHO2_01_FULL_43_30]OGZ59102.1 MAG: 50S ribosomal protein L32 [Candidatus Spechtbacteria bacterium RIFCSPHIGHO2_02_FULL_43_15b]